MPRTRSRRYGNTRAWNHVHHSPQRFVVLGQKIDAAEARAEAAEAENKTLNQTLLERDQEITSLKHQLSLAQAEVDKAEGQIRDLKSAADEGDTHRTTGENLQRKVQLLEEELDKAEKDLKDTTEKLRQVDVKAEHFERQVQRVEQERDDWERKHAEAVEKYQQSKRELDEVVAQMESLVSVPLSCRVTSVMTNSSKRSGTELFIDNVFHAAYDTEKRCRSVIQFY